MYTLEQLQAFYQSKHNVLGLGGKAKMKDDGEGRSGFYNCETQVWDWYAWDWMLGVYIKTGSTQLAI